MDSMYEAQTQIFNGRKYHL